MNQDIADIIKERTKHTECIKFMKYSVPDYHIKISNLPRLEFKNEYLCGFLGGSYL